jgi:hypothetical protein
MNHDMPHCDATMMGDHISRLLGEKVVSDKEEELVG